MGILTDNFQNKIQNLSYAELSALTQLDSNPELVLSSSLVELALHLNSSKSTLFRLAEGLGFAGYTDFKQFVRLQLEKSACIDQADAQNSYLVNFETILRQLDTAKVAYFAEKIYRANSIFLIGLGLTKPVAEYMSKRLYQLDHSSTYVYESHMLDLLPNIARARDCIIFISGSGETAPLISCVKKLSHTAATLLSITNSSVNTLNRLTESSLASNIPVNAYHHYDITSRTYLMLLSDLVLDAYLSKYLKQGKQ